MTNDIADVMDGSKGDRLNGDVSKELCLKKELSKNFFCQIIYCQIFTSLYLMIKWDVSNEYQLLILLWQFWIWQSHPNKKLWKGFDISEQVMS